MPFWGRLDDSNNQIREIIDFDPSGMFVGTRWVQVPDEIAPFAVERGYRWTGSEFVEQPPDRFYSLRARIWERCETDEEAELLDSILQSWPLRQRRMWSASYEVWHDGELYPLLYAALEEQLGQPRTCEILVEDGVE